MGKEGVILAKKKKTCLGASCLQVTVAEEALPGAALSTGLAQHRGELGQGWAGLEEFSFPWEWGTVSLQPIQPGGPTHDGEV